MPRRTDDKPAIIQPQNGARPSAVADPFAPDQPETDLIRPRANRSGDERRNTGEPLASLKKRRPT